MCVGRAGTGKGVLVSMLVKLSCAAVLVDCRRPLASPVSRLCPPSTHSACVTNVACASAQHQHPQHAAEPKQTCDFSSAGQVRCATKGRQRRHLPCQRVIQLLGGSPSGTPVYGRDRRQGQE